MLFRRDIDPCCAYCKRSSQINDREALCSKYGTVAIENSCRSFRYDPLKRIPPRPIVLNTRKFKESDFSL